MAEGDGDPAAAACGGFIDLLGEEPAAGASTSSPGEISFGGSPDAHRQQQPGRASDASDPFAGFDFCAPNGDSPAAADACSSQGQQQHHHHQQQQQEHTKVVRHQQQGEAGLSDSLPKGDQAAGDSVGQDGVAPAERASRLAHILQQHTQNQGQSNAAIRLHLATVAAKQGTVRKLLAELSAGAITAATAADSRSDEHVQQLTSSLQATAAQLATVQQELAAQRRAAAQEAEQHSAEVASLRTQLQQLQDGEGAYQAEIQSLQERLLEAGEQLSRLTGELPGALRGVAASPDGGAGGGGNIAPLSGSSGGGSSGSEAGPAGEAGAVGGSSGGGDGALPATPVAARQGAKPGRSGSMLTPDQSAAAQLKAWLHESQAALMEAQEELMEREAEVRQLQAQLKQQSAGGQVEQHPGAAAAAAAGGDSAESQQQQQLAELQAAMVAAEAAAATAEAEREQLSTELGSLRRELQELKSQLAAADDSRADAVAAYESLKQQAAAAATQQQQEQEQVPPAEAAAAAGRAAAADAELQAALAAAAAASNEVAALQDQLKQLQQQQQAASPDAVTAGSELAGPGTPTVGSSAGAGSLEQLQADSQAQALQTELADTRQRLLLLLRLVRTAAAAAGPGGSRAEHQPALSDQERGQLQRLLAEGVEACGDLDGSSGSKLELGALAQLLQGLQWRYACEPQQLQAAILRGREMQALLQAALAQVHALKAEAGGGSCACPSTADYAQLQPPQPWEQQQATGQQQHHEQQQPFMEQLPPASGTNGSGWLAGPDSVAAAEAAAAAAVGAAAAGGWTDDWHTLPPSVSAGAAAGAGAGSCSTDALRQCLPADEGLSYDGLDGAWWASSTVEPVGELPEFLLKK